jgi:hypothetical protein
MASLDYVLMVTSIIGSVIGVVELLIKPQLQLIRSEIKILNYRISHMEKHLDMESSEPED